MTERALDRWLAGAASAGNLATQIASPEQDKAVPDAREPFVATYGLFAEACRAIDTPGLALVVVDETSGVLVGVRCLRAQANQLVTAILGRHDRCDLALPGNARLALRQLAVVLSPVPAWCAGSAGVRYRILDLRTTAGMQDELGRPLRGLRAEGPAIVRCAGYIVYALPLGDPANWPVSANDAWAWLPERVYLGELARSAEGSSVRPGVRTNGWRPATTLVTHLRGPVDAAMPLVSGGDLAGRLTIRGPRGQGVLAIGYRALRDGVLLGRYERCDAQPLCTDDSLSRVHALLWLVEDRLCVIDLASTNGTRPVVRGTTGGEARVVELTGTEVALGSDTCVTWRWDA